MTNLLYLFNPDQDLALASGEVNYMPPASARRMAEELALLPVWFADGPCSVLAPSAYNQSFLEEMLDLFPLPASLRTQAEMSDIMEAIRSINHQNEDINSEVILFDLNTDNIKRFKSEDYEKIFNHRSDGSSI